MIVIPGLSPLLEAAGKHISFWDESGSRLVVEAGSIVQSAVCPRCTYSSSRPHGRYRRWVADCPSFGKPVTLAVEVQRFKCVNPGCPPALCPRAAGCNRQQPLCARSSRRQHVVLGAWVLGWQECKLTQTERSDRERFVETLCRIEPTVAAARELAPSVVRSRAQP